MKNKSILKLSYLAMFMALLFTGCERDSFGEDKEVAVAPSSLRYVSVIDAREFSYIETSRPSINSNGELITYEITQIKKDETILDESYLNSVSILNYSVIETNWELNETGEERQFEGIVDGTILKEKRGDHGFGYDPIFKPAGENRTFAEMNMQEKSKISHRGKAIQQLVAYLENQ